MADELSKSTALHEAVARYFVGISRMVPTRRTEEVESGLTYRQAKEMQSELEERLRGEEPQWENCMCRSLAVIELTNKSEVSRVLGYGPGFSYDAAVESVAVFLRDARSQLDAVPEVDAMRLDGLRQVTEAFEMTCV